MQLVICYSNNSKTNTVVYIMEIFLLPQILYMMKRNYVLCEKNKSGFHNTPGFLPVLEDNRVTIWYTLTAWGQQGDSLIHSYSLRTTGWHDTF